MIVETPGIGQGDAAIVPFVDVPMYVMTPEFGAASQLEKIDMLDFADIVAINKFERRGAEDALRDVRRQLARNREAFDVEPDELPVFGTVAARFNDDGVTALYQHLGATRGRTGLPLRRAPSPRPTRNSSTRRRPDRPAGAGTRYLAEITETVRGYHARTAEQAGAARRHEQLVAQPQRCSPSTATPTADVDALPATAAADPRPAGHVEAARGVAGAPGGC